MCIVGSPEKGLLGIGQGKNVQMGKATDQAFHNGSSLSPRFSLATLITRLLVSDESISILTSFALLAVFLFSFLSFHYQLSRTSIPFVVSRTERSGGEERT